MEITDPQNDFLSSEGVAWELVGESVEENDTVEHIGQLIDTAKRTGHLVAVSPHYYYPFDHEWHFGGTLEEKMHEIGMFDRRGPLAVDDVPGSGADFLPAYKAQLGDGYASAMTNLGYIASDVITTSEAVGHLESR